MGSCVCPSMPVLPAGWAGDTSAWDAACHPAASRVIIRYQFVLNQCQPVTSPLSFKPLLWWSWRSRAVHGLPCRNRLRVLPAGGRSALELTCSPSWQSRAAAAPSQDPWLPLAPQGPSPPVGSGPGPARHPPAQCSVWAGPPGAASGGTGRDAHFSTRCRLCPSGRP